MPVPAQTPQFVNKDWVVFIKDAAFNELYDVYCKNFESPNRFLREYSVLWFRQIWGTLNEMAGMSLRLGSFSYPIHNGYNSSRPIYGQIYYDTKRLHSKKDGKIVNLLIVKHFDFSLPYREFYGGHRIMLTNSVYRNTLSLMERLNRLPGWYS